MSAQRTIEQRRAEEAWNKIKEVLEKDWKDKYLPLAQSAPADIQNNGLAQTLAFWGAKRESHHKALYGHVSGWVMRQMGLGGQDLLGWITNANTSSEQYRQATVEAMAFLVWIKRFAEAELR
ncbi:MAG: type III-B CRISPR module-associated protein Cmr5 [Methanotrichaceae archaeon]